MHERSYQTHHHHRVRSKLCGKSQLACPQLSFADFLVARIPFVFDSSLQVVRLRDTLFVTKMKSVIKQSDVGVKATYISRLLRKYPSLRYNCCVIKAPIYIIVFLLRNTFETSLNMIGFNR